MKAITFFWAALFVVSTVLAAPIAPIPITPDEALTPGEYCNKNDKDFDGYRYPEKMVYCKRNVSKSLKERTYKAYNIPAKCHHRYTIDHFVPLALGGNNSSENLWPEHKLVKATRQQLEQELYLKVSDGEMTSDEATLILIEEKTKLNLDLSHLNGCG